MHRRIRSLLAVALVAGSTTVVGTVAAAPASQAATGFVTSRVDTLAGAPNGGYGAYRPAISADGRYVAFVSDEPLLPNVAKPANLHVYRLDRQTAQLVQVDVSSSGQGSDGGVPRAGGLPSFGVSISDDGDTIGFHNAASNLDPTAPSYVRKADPVYAGTWWSFYVRHVSAGTTDYAAVPVSPALADQWTYKQVDGTVSANGRTASFEAQVSVSGRSVVAVWQRDLVARTTTAVSRASNSATGTPGALTDNTSYHLPVSTSADGRYVAFEQYSSTLGASSSRAAVYVRDTVAGKTTALSSSVADVHLAGFRGISDDGRYVIASTIASLTSPSAGGVNAVYLRDLTLGTWTLVGTAGPGGAVATVPVDPAGAALSPDGSRLLLATATPLTSDDTNKVSDVYSRALPGGSAVRVSLDTDDAQYGTAATQPAMSRDGSVASFSLLDTTATSGRTPTHVLARAYVGTTTASFTDVSLTSAETTGGSATSLPGAVQVPVSNIPATAVPQEGLARLAGLPIGTLKSLPIGTLPIGTLPIGTLPIGTLPIGTLPLSELPFVDPGHRGWDTYLVGTRYAGDPIQSVTLPQLLALGSVNGISSLSLGEVDLSRTRLRSISTASIVFAGTGLGNIPISGPSSDSFTNWCTAIAATGQTCSQLGLTSSSSVLAVDLAGVPIGTLPIGTLPIGTLPIGTLPIGTLPIGTLTLAGTPIGTLPIGTLPIGTLPIGTLPIGTLPTTSPVRTIPVSALPSGVVTGTCNGNPCATLGDAIDAGAVASGKTIKDLGPALNGFSLADLGTYGSTTLAQLVQSLPSNVVLTVQQVLLSLLNQLDYPFENLDLNALGVQDYASTGGVVRYTAAFTLAGSGAAIPDTSAAVTLPRYWRLVPGSTTFGGPGPVGAGLTDVTTPVQTTTPTGTTLTWHLPSRAVGTGKAQTVTFLVRPGLDTQDSQVSTLALRASGGGLASPITATATDGGVAVVDSTPNTTASSAPVVPYNTLILGHIRSATDVNYYRIPAPANGARLSISLSDNTQDNDLVLYRPVANQGPSSTPIGTLPLLPLTDEGTDATTTASQAPETLQDLPIGTLPIGTLSAHRGTAQESIDYTAAPSPAGSFYTIQVSGYNGAFSSKPYVLLVKSTQPRVVTCSARTLPFAGEGATAAATVPSVPAGTKTAYLVNTKQLRDTYGAAATDPMLSKLATFAAGGAGAGTVLTVDGDAAVRSAMAAWNASPCSVDAANAYARAVDALVLTARNGDPALANLVIVGGDDVLPMGRVPDGTRISNERDYAQSDKGGDGSDNPLTASQAGANILTDDVYGDLDPVAWLDHQLYVPELAVGRLPESPAEVSTALQAFTDAGGVIDPGTALSAGYDFVADGARAADAALARKATTHATLINATWDRAALSGQLFPTGVGAQSPNISALYAHYDHNRLLPSAGNTAAANGTSDPDLFTVGDIQANRLKGRLVFTLGCHSGLNVPDSYVGGSSAAVSRDWVQTYTQQGAVYVANTGYGLGDTDTVGYSEALLASFAGNLDGSLTVGQALTAAKQAYYASIGIGGVYDEKAMTEATLYGLPFWRIGTSAPAGGGAAARPTAIADPAAGATIGSPSTDVLTGLTSTPVSLAPSFGNPVTATSGRGKYWTVGGEVQASHNRPIQPRTHVIVNPASGQQTHGVLITGLTSTDVPGIDPVYETPTIDTSANEPEVRGGPAVFPSTFAAVSTAAMPYGPESRLVVVPGQFTTATGSSGTQRLFTSMSTQVLSSSSTATPVPPRLSNVIATRTPASVTFKADVTSPTGAAIARAVVLWREVDPSADPTLPVTWKLAELTHGTNSSHWFAQAATTHDVQWFVQAATTAGDVGTSTYKGSFFTASVGFSAGTFGSEGKAGYFTGPVVVTVDGPGAPYSATVDGQQVGRADPQFTVTGDGTHTVVVTGADGSHSLQPIKIDATAPTVAFRDHPTATFLLHETTDDVIVCTDATSGVDSCPPSPAVVTDRVGQFTVPYTATDKAGNATSGQLSYRVVYEFVGFSGAANAPTYNSATAGSVLAPHFDVQDANAVSQGAVGNTSAVSSVTSSQVACAPNPVGGAAVGVAAQSALVYLTDFQYLWVTDPAYRGTCRRLDVKLADATVHSLFYDFS